MSIVADSVKVVKDVAKEASKLKKSDAVLMRTRDAIVAIFRNKGESAKNAVNAALVKNKLRHADVANQKIGSDYNPEFRRLWQMVIDTFNNLGRKDLAEKFASTVPPFTENKHDVSFVSTLLNGAASSKPVTITTVTSGPGGTSKEVLKVNSPAVAADNNYKMLEPFKGTMQAILIAQGFAAPSGMEDLSQLFYNKVVAGKDGYDRINFFDATPEQTYHLDQSIVDAIVSFFKGLADRKQKGEVLPKWQDAAATKTLEIQAQLEQSAKGEIAKDIGTVLMSKQGIIITAIVFVAIIIAVIAALKN